MSVKAVYIHLGGNIPKYLQLGLLRQTKLFPEISTVLIVSEEENIPKKITGIDYYVYKGTYKQALSEVSTLSNLSNFRNNYLKS